MDVEGNQKDEGKQQASNNVDPEDNEVLGIDGWDDDEDYKDSEDEGMEEAEKPVQKKKPVLPCPQMEGESDEDY
eukprot:scaffold18389_cov99-Amphora_coffeaeformis.AAC.2